MRRETVELPMAASRDSAVPLAAQIAAQLRTAMTEGRLKGGERLPASRALAAELGVSRTVVNGAYAQLFAEGWIEGRHGSGTYVADGAPADHATATPLVTAKPGPTEPGPGGAVPLSGRYSPVAPAGPAAAIDLRPGIPWIAGIDLAVWRRAWRAAGLRPPIAPHPAGLAELRAAVAVHVRRSRGIQCTPAEILVTQGIAGGLSLIAATLLRP